MLPSCTTNRWMKNMHQRISEATHEKSLELPSPGGKFWVFYNFLMEGKTEVWLRIHEPRGHRGQRGQRGRWGVMPWPRSWILVL